MKQIPWLFAVVLYAAQSFAADEVPQLVAPGVVSTSQGEYSPTYDARRKELVFMRRTPGRFDYRLFSSRRTADGWTTPVLLPFSGRYRDAGPSFSPDGSRLVFDSRRPHPLLGGNDIDLWQAQRLGDSWGTPTPLLAASVNPADEPAPQRDEFGPVLTAGGDLLWYSFRSPRRGGAFYRLGEDGNVAMERELPDPSAPTFVAYFTLSADGSTAVIEGRNKARGDTDLFYSCRVAGQWTAARPLPVVNSTSGDGGPYLAPDNSILFFASDRPTESSSSAASNIYSIPTDALPIPCPANAESSR